MATTHLLVVCVVGVIFAAAEDPTPVCHNLLDNCDSYPNGACQPPYEEWAKKNCNLKCGFCQGPPTPGVPCVDVLPNCDQYQKDTCTNTFYAKWAADNCRLYCGLCGGGTPHPNYPTPPGPVAGKKRSLLDALISH